MPAKGAVSKETLIKYLQDCLAKHSDVIGVFSPDGKELRADMSESGTEVQIKISLTAVKSPITNNPNLQVVNEEQFSITEAEKEELQNTLNELGVSF